MNKSKIKQRLLLRRPITDLYSEPIVDHFSVCATLEANGATSAPRIPYQILPAKFLGSKVIVRYLDNKPLSNQIFAEILRQYHRERQYFYRISASITQPGLLSICTREDRTRKTIKATSHFQIMGSSANYGEQNRTIRCKLFLRFVSTSWVIMGQYFCIKTTPCNLAIHYLTIHIPTMPSLFTLGYFHTNQLLAQF